MVGRDGHRCSPHAWFCSLCPRCALWWNLDQRPFRESGGYCCPSLQVFGIVLYLCDGLRINVSPSRKAIDLWLNNCIQLLVTVCDVPGAYLDHRACFPLYVRSCSILLYVSNGLVTRWNFVAAASAAVLTCVNRCSYGLPSVIASMGVLPRSRLKLNVTFCCSGLRNWLSRASSVFYGMFGHLRQERITSMLQKRTRMLQNVFRAISASQTERRRACINFGILHSRAGCRPSSSAHLINVSR